MDFFQGDRVRVLGKPEWGPGIIQEHSKNGKVKVRFLGAGRKKLDLRHAKLIKVVLRDTEWLEQKARETWGHSSH